MKTYSLLYFFSQPAQWLYVFIATAMLFLSGCATQMSVVDEETAGQICNPPPEKDKNIHVIPVIRYGRYTLVEVENPSIRPDVLQQIVDVTIPISVQKKETNVAEAMRYLLLNSGYQLCDSDDTGIFNTFPLPLAHQHLGPMTLQDALMVLAGSGWEMQVEHFSRHICFTPEAKTTAPAKADAEPMLKERSE